MIEGQDLHYPPPPTEPRDHRVVFSYRTMSRPTFDVSGAREEPLTCHSHKRLKVPPDYFSSPHDSFQDASFVPFHVFNVLARIPRISLLASHYWCDGREARSCVTSFSPFGVVVTRHVTSTKRRAIVADAAPSHSRCTQPPLSVFESTLLAQER